MAKRVLVTGTEELNNLVKDLKTQVKESAETVRGVLENAGYGVDLTDAGLARKLAEISLREIFAKQEVIDAVQNAAAQLLSDVDYLVGAVDAYELEEAEADAEDLEAVEEVA